MGNKSKSRKRRVDINKKKNGDSGLKKIKISFFDPPNNEGEQLPGPPQSPENIPVPPTQNTQQQNPQPPVNQLCEDGKCSIVRPKNRSATKKKQQSKPNRQRRKTNGQKRDKKKKRT